MSSPATDLEKAARNILSLAAVVKTRGGERGLARSRARFDGSITQLEEALGALLNGALRSVEATPSPSDGPAPANLAAALTDLSETCEQLAEKLDESQGAFKAALQQAGKLLAHVKRLAPEVKPDKKDAQPAKKDAKPDESPLAAKPAKAPPDAKKPPAPPPSALVMELRRLANSVAKLEGYADDPDGAEFQKHLERAAAQWEAVRLQAKRASRKTSTISEFFDAIGTGFVAAQKNLDRVSEEYARSSLRGRALPSGTKPKEGTKGAKEDARPPLATMFRIPKVSAELKCSLETTKEKKLNVVFYSDRNDVRELHQQTVHIEFVSVPVPPEYLNALAQEDRDKRGS